MDLCVPCGQVDFPPWGTPTPPTTAQVACLRGHVLLVNALLDAGAHVSRLCFEAVLQVDSEHAGQGSLGSIPTLAEEPGPPS